MERRHPDTVEDDDDEEADAGAKPVPQQPVSVEEALEQRLFSAINSGARLALLALLGMETPELPASTKSVREGDHSSRDLDTESSLRNSAASDASSSSPYVCMPSFSVRTSSVNSKKVNNPDASSIRSLSDALPGGLDAVLQLLLTTTYPNSDGFYAHDVDVLPDALELLGPSLEHLNAIQIACILGDEESALDILNFVANSTEEIGARKVLCEFMGRVWGDGNTILHLASFLGMSELVKRLLELGANPNKRNGRMYKPVDCADTDETRRMFNSVVFSEAVSSKTRIFRTYLTESYTRGDRNEQPIVITDRCLPKAGFESDHHFSTSYSQFTSIQSTLHVPRVANFNNTTTACAESSPAQTRSFSQPTEFDVDLILTQKSFSPSPIRHSKTKSLDSGASKSFHANFNHLNKGILNARLPSTSSLASSTTTASRKKKVKFTPATLLLDLLQHGPETDPHPQPAIQRLLDPVTGVADLQTLQTPQQSLSLLHLACANGRVEVVRTLLRRGDVPVNTRDREGWTPLHCACAEGHMDVVSLLGRVCSWVEDDERCEQFDSQDREVFWVVDGPVELEAKNGDGETPEMVALDERKEDVRMIFKELRMLRTKGNEIASNPDCANKSDQEASVCGPDVQNLLHIPIVAQLSPPLTPQISNLCEHKDVLMVSCSVATPTKSMICLQLEQPAKLDQITPPVTCIHAKATPLSDLQQPSSPHQQPCVKDQPPFSVLSSPKISPIPFLQTLQSTEAEDTSYALEEAPKSPKPLRGSAAKLIAAFNQISSTTAGAKSSFFRGVSLSTSNLCSPSRFGSGRGSRFGSISTFEVTRPHVEAAKELSTLNKLSLVTSWDTVGNASVPTVAPLAQANSVSSSSPVLSATGRRRSLLVHQRRDSSEVGGVAVVSTASDNTLHKREDVAKKKKAHRLSETTSGFFSWMDGGGVVNKQSHSNLSLKTLNTS